METSDINQVKYNSLYTHSFLTTENATNIQKILTIKLLKLRSSEM